MVRWAVFVLLFGGALSHDHRPSRRNGNGGKLSRRPGRRLGEDGVRDEQCATCPFASNHTAAYQFPGFIKGEWQNRHIVSLRAKVNVALEKSAAEGLSWNSLGLSFPPGWDFASSVMKNVIEPYFLMSGRRAKSERGIREPTDMDSEESIFVFESTTFFTQHLTFFSRRSRQD